MQRSGRRAGVRSSGPEEAPAWLLRLLSNVAERLIDDQEPNLTPDDLVACARVLATQHGNLLTNLLATGPTRSTLWGAGDATLFQLLTLHAVAVRRSALLVPSGEGLCTNYATLRHGLTQGLLEHSVVLGCARPITLACVRGDALLVYRSLLAESAEHLGAHARLRRSSAEQQQQQQQAQPINASLLPKLPFLIKEASFRMIEALRVADVARTERSAWVHGIAPPGAGPRPPAANAVDNGSDSAFETTVYDLPTLQLLQLGVVDSCCRVLLYALPLAARTRALTDALNLPVILSNLLLNVKDTGSVLGLWMGSAAALLPPSRTPLVAGADGQRASTCAGSSSSSSGPCGHPPAHPPPLIGCTGRQFPTALQCLLAAHVVRLCAALDGGPTYGLLEDSPGTHGVSPGSQGDSLGGQGGAGAGSPLVRAPLLDRAGVPVMTDGDVQGVLSAELAVAAVRMWVQAGELWEGSAVRDSWRAVVEAERAAGIQRPVTATANAAGGGEGSWRRRRRAAVAALRRQLAEAEAGSRAASGAGAAGLAGTAGPSTSTAVAPAVEAMAAAAAAHGRLTFLRGALATLEVEEVAERVPPLNRMATVELCCRLAAAAVQTLTGGPGQHCSLEVEGARDLVWRSLECWRLALAPERTCPRRPAPAAVVKRLERWWGVALRAMASAECVPEVCGGLAPEIVALTNAGWAAAGGADRVVSSLYCGPCLAPLPGSLPAGPRPDMAAALSAGLLPAMAEDYRHYTVWCGPALLTASMQRLHGGWCDAAMFGHVADVARVVDAAASRMTFVRRRFATVLAQGALSTEAGQGALGPDAAEAEAALNGDVAVAAALLDSQLLSCLVHLAGQAPPVGSSVPGACADTQLPGSPSPAPALGATAAEVPGPGPAPSPVHQLGLVVSYTAAQLLQPMCKCLLALRGEEVIMREVLRTDAWARGVQCAACWVVQWLLLLLQVALVDAGADERAAAALGGQQPDRPQEQAAGGGAQEPRAAGVESGSRHGQREQAEGPRRGLPMAAAWRLQLLDQLDVVGVLRGLLRLLAAYPRVDLGSGPNVGQLRDVLEPQALAACLDAAAAAFPEEVDAAFGGYEGRETGGPVGLVAQLRLQMLMGEGGPLESDWGSGTHSGDSGGSCFWAVMERGPGGAGAEAVERVVREAGERARRVVGLVVPSEEAIAGVRVRGSA